MIFDPETKHWQQQYQEGKIPQEWLDECCGETLALLNGSAEREAIIPLIVCVGFVILFPLMCWIISIYKVG